MNHRESRDSNQLRSATPLPWWLIAIFVAGSVLIIAGGLIALFRPEMLLSPHQQITEATHIYAGYLVSRNLALGLMLLAALALRARAPLSALMVLYASIQFLDAITDCVEGRWTIVPGIVMLGLLFLIGAARASEYSFRSTKPRWQTS